MNYYIEQNGKIVLFDTEKERLQQTLEFTPQYTDLEIKETDRPIENFQFADTEEYQSEQAQAREQAFLQDFFKVQYNEQELYFRKQPKGYSSAVESINTAFNIVGTVGILPAGSLIFYQQPDFTDETQCTEEWLVEHQIRSEEMTATEFGTFYAGFITAWNAQEHK